LNTLSLKVPDGPLSSWSGFLRKDLMLESHVGMSESQRYNTDVGTGSPPCRKGRDMIRHSQRGRIYLSKKC